MKSIAKGTLILFTRGSHDDYSMEGLYVALKDFEYAPATVHQMSRNTFDALISTATILKIEATEIWLGRT